MVRMGAVVDSALARWAARGKQDTGGGSLPTRHVETRAGRVRVHESGGGDRCVVIVPDGPNVIEHYAPVIAQLAARARVVCFDLPGFGFSVPGASYDHSLDGAAAAVLDVLDAVDVGSATLAFSCANGYYALRVAQRSPDRVSRLVLSQTPSLVAMHQWVDRTVPGFLRVPVLGQAAGWLLRHRFATAWYRMALPPAADIEGFRGPAVRALAGGACFSLAGVVQGLGREQWWSLSGVEVPCTMIWGTHDRTHARTDPGTLLEAVPHADIVRFEGCGHFPDLEEPARFAAALA